MPGGEAWKKRYDAKYAGQFQIYSPYHCCPVKSRTKSIG
jgi:hypothetical protein